ncbi:helix-turn-helix transcriptional regulator [Polycladidibacter stylochi]|uniref:helix-turn-helix transcriptional regulator n=1 Tax=Polycladidibacter stylochi TaxID=1807766 RepID=UPI0008321FC4|nr:YafY family protein [Pseudovibrio stylochi]
MRTQRLFQLLDKLRAAKYPLAANALAESLNVSERTIYRDIKSLQQMGAPIRGESGLGYQIEKGYFLPPLHFNRDELDALVLGLRMLASQADPQLADAAASVQAKVAVSLPEHSQDALARTPLLAPPSQSEKAQSNRRYMQKIRHAIADRKKLIVTYKDISQAQTKRTLHPLGLAVFSDIWVLTCYCELRNSFRNFRLDRLLTVHTTEEKFSFEPSKEFHAFLKTVPNGNEQQK